jgi:small subunit ribosomal protein S17
VKKMTGKITIIPSKRTFTGIVVSAKMRRTVSVRIERRVILRKYERYAKRYSTIKAHNPDNIAAEEGDIVVIAETRPLSKSKHFIVIKKAPNKAKEEK